MTRTGQRLVALEGGPKDGQWYWLTDWHTHLETMRAYDQDWRPGQPASAALHYQPTGRHIDNPNPKYGPGEVWRYTPADDGARPWTAEA